MLAPILSWQTTSRGLPARSKLIRIAGLDVAAPVGTGNGLGVDPESIEVYEAAAGSVSRMKFTITDPQGQLAMQALDPVLFWDTTRDLPIFRGWVQRSPTRPLGLGRLIDVNCIGIEAILDWAYVPTFTIPATVDIEGAFQMICSAAVGVNGAPIRWATDGGGSSVAMPIEGAFLGLPIGIAYTVPAGTLRQALRSYAEFKAGVFDIAPSTHWISVDMWGGIRIWTYQPGTTPGGVTWAGGPNDAGQIDFTTAGPARPSGTEYEIDAGSMPRTAVVTGSGGNVTVVSDGTGLPGPSVAKTDTNATTNALRTAIGLAMLAAQAGGDAGATTAEGTVNMGTFGLQNRPGALMTILDAQAGLPVAISTWVGGIRKTWAPSGEETWRVEFGSKRTRTATGLLRRMAQGELA